MTWWQLNSEMFWIGPPVWSFGYTSHKNSKNHTKTHNQKQGEQTETQSFFLKRKLRSHRSEWRMNFMQSCREKPLAIYTWISLFKAGSVNIFGYEYCATKWLRLWIPDKRSLRLPAEEKSRICCGGGVMYSKVRLAGSAWNRKKWPSSTVSNSTGGP